jgi:cleavage stimulation factor subunit 3
MHATQAHTHSTSSDRVASMAEEDAEIALLHQMQAGQESMAWGDGADGHEEGVLPSNTENSDQQVKEENFSDDQVLRALSPSVSGVSPDDDTYDPLSPPPVPAAVLTPARIDSRSSSRASARRPRTIGGFLADDSDEDDLDPPTNLSQTASSANVHLQPQTGDGLGRAVSRSPLHISSTPQEQNFAEVINAPVTVPVAAADASLDRGNQPATQNVSIQESTPLSSSASTAAALNVPKARLPLDRVGILEDRIKEDPRGDTDAWLSLISEHRKRNKIEDARAVYERFFKVFPSAVSSNHPFLVLRSNSSSVPLYVVQLR